MYNRFTFIILLTNMAWVWKNIWTEWYDEFDTCNSWWRKINTWNKIIDMTSSNILNTIWKLCVTAIDYSDIDALIRYDTSDNEWVPWDDWYCNIHDITWTTTPNREWDLTELFN